MPEGQLYKHRITNPNYLPTGSYKAVPLSTSSISYYSVCVVRQLRTLIKCFSVAIAPSSHDSSRLGKMLRDLCSCGSIEWCETVEDL